jgi:hypothetical protein
MVPGSTSTESQAWSLQISVAILKLTVTRTQLAVQAPDLRDISGVRGDVVSTFSLEVEGIGWQ